VTVDAAWEATRVIRVAYEAEVVAAWKAFQAADRSTPEAEAAAVKVYREATAAALKNRVEALDIILAAVREAAEP